MLGGGGGGESFARTNINSKDPPMLQSARVKRELVTIVPRSSAVSTCGKWCQEHHSCTLHHRERGSSSSGSRMIPLLLRRVAPHLPQSSKKRAESTTTTTFSKHLHPDLFGTPRPLSSAVEPSMINSEKM